MREIIGQVEGKGKRVAIIVSRFNQKITNILLEGALQALRQAQVAEDDIAVTKVPGAYEIPFLAKKLAFSRQFDAIICLGAVIRGETSHYDFVAGEASAGIAKVAHESDIPVIFGVLTTDTVAQALERADLNAGNKGRYAAKAALEMASLAGQWDALLPAEELVAMES